MTAPYKKPERDLPDNERFNNHVSIVRIRSEHAIGYLKGRFHSLKNLRVVIRDRDTHVLATYWVAACIGLHAFAMRCEADERETDEDIDDDYIDPFIREGMSSSSDSDDPSIRPPPRSSMQGSKTRLQQAKAFREKLKAQLFHEKAKQADARTRSSLYYTSGMDDTNTDLE